MKIFSYPRKINDWRRKTAKLPLEQRGAYSELIDWYYIEEGLSYDLEELCRMIGATKRSEKESVKKVINNPDLFTVVKVGDKLMLVQPMCDETIILITQKSLNARNSANAKYNKINNITDANAERTQCERSANPNPTHKPKESITQSSFLPTQVRAGDKNGILDSGRSSIRVKQSTLDSAKKMLPGADIYSLFEEWKASGKGLPENPDGAFIGWCKGYKKNHPEFSR